MVVKGLNDVEELEKIRVFKNIESLEISECRIITRIPNNITHLSKLKKLTFNWNGGSDSAINWSHEIDKICGLKNLEILILGLIMVSGTCLLKVVRSNP